MYLHAYQSYLWNHAASDRATRFGLAAAVEGDLVLCSASGEAPVSAPESDALGVADAAAATNASAAGEEALADGDAAVLAMEACGNLGDGDLQGALAAEAPAGADGCGERSAAGGEKGAAGGGAAQPRVRRVTAQEAAAGSVPITAVVLPLPAPGVEYPGHATAEVYERMAAADGVSLTGGQHAVRHFSMASLTGGFRRLVQRPEGMSWALLRYGAGAEELTETDWSRHGQKASGGGRGGSAGVEGIEPGKAGELLALRLTFALPSSCYATMLIRELLKSSTSKEFHKALGGHDNAGKGGLGEVGAGAMEQQRGDGGEAAAGRVSSILLHGSEACEGMDVQGRREGGALGNRETEQGEEGV